MRQNASTGNESTAGPMGPIEQWIVDCPDCGFRERVSDKWGADDMAAAHAGETDHEPPEVTRE